MPDQPVQEQDRWRQCLASFNPLFHFAGNRLDAPVERGNEGAGTSTTAVPSTAPDEAARQLAADEPREPSASTGAGGPEDYEMPYQVLVEGFERATGYRRRANAPMVFLLTVTHGEARWPLRRRYRQVWELHQRLLQGLGHNAIQDGLPVPPPRITPRSAVFGGADQRFLQARSVALQRYLDALLRYIPFVDQCEALREFLCTVDMRDMTYDNLLELEEAIGTAGNVGCLDEATVSALPRRDRSNYSPAVKGQDLCVICREPLSTSSKAVDEEDEDIRVLPCGHEYHFKCISRWLARNNSCCICLSAIVAAPVESAC